MNSDDFDPFLNAPSKFISKAASFIMKLMYRARMAMLQFCVTVPRLASQITRWSADSMRWLLRVYGYLHANPDKDVTSTISKSDPKKLKIIAWPDANFNGDFMSTKRTDSFFVEVAGREGRGFDPGLAISQTGINSDAHRRAETISLAHCCKREFIPFQIALQAMLGHAVDCIVKKTMRCALSP